MTIDEISGKFVSELNIVEYFEQIRWGRKPKCAYCGSTKLSNRYQDFRFFCFNCRRASSVRVGTFLHNTNLSLRAWLNIFSIISKAEKGVSASQIKKDLNINYPSAWKIYCKLRNMLSLRLNDGDIIGRVMKASCPRKIKRLLKGNKRLNKYRKSCNSILCLNNSEDNLKFSKILMRLNKGLDFMLLLQDVRINERESFWKMLENHIREHHNPIDLKNWEQYFMEAVFEIAPVKEINMFETLVKNSMKETKWQRTKRIKY
jgi:hypothetical protein